MNLLFMATAADPGEMSFFTRYGSLIIIAVMLVGFYFLLIRPQRKEQKQKQLMLNAMTTGDTVLTSSGFYGVIIDIQDDTVIVEFGSNRNCRIPMQKAAIIAVEKPSDAVAQAAPAVEKKAETKTEEKKTQEK